MLMIRLLLLLLLIQLNASHGYSSHGSHRRPRREEVKSREEDVTYYYSEDIADEDNSDPDAPEDPPNSKKNNTHETRHEQFHKMVNDARQGHQQQGHHHMSSSSSSIHKGYEVTTQQNDSLTPGNVPNEEETSTSANSVLHAMDHSGVWSVFGSGGILAAIIMGGATIILLVGWVLLRLCRGISEGMTSSRLVKVLTCFDEHSASSCSGSTSSTTDCSGSTSSSDSNDGVDSVACARRIVRDCMASLRRDDTNNIEQFMEEGAPDISIGLSGKEELFWSISLDD